MRYSNNKSWKKLLPLLMALLLASTASAYSLSWENPQEYSSAGHWTKGTLEINVSASDGAKVNHTWFWYNTSQGYNLIDDSKNNTPDQTYWTASLDTTTPGSDTIELLVNSTNQTNETLGRESTTTIIVRDNDPPDSLTLDSPENDTVLSSLFSINASWNDAVSGVGSEGAMYDIANSSGLYSAGTLNATGVDLTDLNDGVYDINLNVTDRANNTLANNTASRIRVDNNPPELVSSSVYPENGSKTGEDLPSIGFNLTDFIPVNTSTITVWLERESTTDKYGSSALDFNTLEGWNDNRTVSVDLKPDSSLAGGMRYNITVRAEDEAGQMMSNTTFWFRTNFTPPKFEGYTTYGKSSDRDGDEWFRDNVTVQIHCTSRSGSPMDSYNLSGKLGQNEEKTSSQEKTNLTFDVDPDTESSTNLTMGCTDEGGHATTSYFIAHLDSSSPAISSRTPSPNSSVDNSSNQLIEAKITDNGAGLSESDVDSDLDPEFNGNSVSSYSIEIKDKNTTAVISWNESTEPNKTYDIGLDGSGTYSVTDLLDQNLDKEGWSFNTTSSSSDSQDDTTDSNQGSGGGLTSQDVVFSSVPSGIDILPGASKTVDVELENTANSSASIDLSADTDNNYLNASFVLSALTLAETESRDFKLSFNSSPLLSGSVTVELNLEEDGKSSSAEFTVEAISEARELVINPPNFVDVEKGGNASFSFDASNNGRTVLEDLRPSLDRFLDSVKPESFGLEVNETTSVNMSIYAPEGIDTGKYSQEVNVSSSQVSRSGEVVIRVQPSSEEVKQNISSGIEDLRKDLEARGNFSTRKRVEDLISDAERAVEKGNYVKASELREKIRDLLDSAEVSEEGSSAIYNIIFYVLGIIIVSLLVAGLVYFLAFRGGYGMIKSRFNDLKQDISRRFSRSEDSNLEENDETVEFDSSGDDVEDMDIEEER